MLILLKENNMAIVRTTIETDSLLMKKIKAISLVSDIPIKEVITLGLEASIINWEQKHGVITVSKEQINITKNGRN